MGYVFENCRLIPELSGGVGGEGLAVAVEGGKIAAVGGAEGFGGERIDCRGATLLHGRTALLGRSCEVIICVVPIRLMNGIKRAALGADPGAFITVCPVRDVSGRGFTLADIDLPLGGASDGA